ECRFQVAHKAPPCSPHSLSAGNTTLRTCTEKGEGKLECAISCAEGHRFVDEAEVVTQFTCEDGEWSPAVVAPSCAPLAEEPARYELSVRVEYPTQEAIGQNCLQAYSDAVAAHFESLDSVLSTRCSSSVQVFVRILDVRFSFEHDKIAANYTIQILPTVLQNVFYDLCSLTLRTIFDLRIPGATTPVKQLLSIPVESLTLPTGQGCPALQATRSSIAQGFGCSPGDVLRETAGEGLPECLPCPSGAVNVNNTCVKCPAGSYQDLAGQVACKACPDSTWTASEGSIGVAACLPTCGNGMFSASGLVPCQACPRHTFAGPPTQGGVKRCEACPSGGYTATVGASGPSQCKQPCGPGSYSATGLQPCSPCAANSFQSGIGQQRCQSCPEDSHTAQSGAKSEEACEKIDCEHVKCRNKGECIVRNHAAVCECAPGYTGPLCEKTESLCDAQPCVNGGTCEIVSGTFRCRCPSGYSGRTCQLGPHECAGVRCPNGGVCHDLPGIGTTKCVCRTGFAGPHCEEITDACSERSPCLNGAECVPQALGRFKCKCSSGWTGPTCEENIDDCASTPCAMGAKCVDLVNDFRCECPSGFSGKRCSVKEELCTADACLHGMCIDRLTSKECMCEPGWTGPACDVNIDECEGEPCENGGTCRDQVNAFSCSCPTGFHGSRCQHLVDHCTTAPCSNNGTCTNHGVSFSCECPLGFEGDTCDEDVDDCKNAQCLEQGTLRCVDGVDAYDCLCKDGWEGKMCETKIDQCAAQPCLNDGTCVDTGAAFTCECAAGWSGARCETETGACTAKPCKNDAVCLNLANDYFCVCSEGVSGRNCEHSPDRCIGSPCKNGGVCTDLGSRLECACPKGRSGDGCQFLAASCTADTCQNGGACEGDVCKCRDGFTGVHCEKNVDECASIVCPKGARCVDQIGKAVCVCPTNATGVTCEKAIDTSYDLHFTPDAAPSRAARRVPTVTMKRTEEITIAAWIKFDREGEEGRVLGLYNSSSPNYAADLHEMLSVSSSSISVSLVPELAPVTFGYPNSVKINDGRWHHLSLTWSSSSGLISLILDSVRVHSEPYGKAAGFDASLHLVLGDAADSSALASSSSLTSSPSTSSSSFTGRLARVSLWDRALDFEAEIPTLVGDCVGAPEILDGLLIRFADFDDITGRVEREEKSDCGAIDGGKKEGEIHVEFCPDDVSVVTAQREANVSWQEPKFFLSPLSSAHIVGIRQNRRSNTALSEGVHDVVYVATDDIGRTAHCSFKVNVIRSLCPRLAEPQNGLQNCESWGPSLRYKACSIRCRDGFAFSVPPSSFYTCAADGVWRPTIEGATPHAPFKYPQCTKHVPATRMVSLSLDYPAVSPCTSAGRDALKDNVRAKILELNERWSFCNLKDTNGCVGSKISVECESIASMMMRRRAKKDLTERKRDDHDLTEIYREKREERPAQQMFKLKVELPVKRENLFDPRSGRTLSVVEILEEEILGHRVLSLEKILPNGRADLHSLRVDDVFNCQTGSVVVEDLCVPCAPGTFFDAASQSCTSCAVGQYQQVAGRTQCKTCPPGFTTVTRGAVDESECKVSCPVGHFLDLSDSSTTQQCKPCGFAFYQPVSGSFECLSCPSGQTTLTTTAASVDECRDECQDGFELSSAGGCSACPHGWYRGRGAQARCVQCPSGTTTSSDKATRREDCDTPRCSIGQFLVPASKQCQLCPRGAYQDEEEKTSCKLCPADHATAALGATTAAQCYSTNQCATGEDNCSWHALCIDLPDVLDQPRFECRCKPGYRGNGTHCYDACQNFCLNDGVCKKNPIGFVECVCKETFTGERCEHRFQPKGQKVAIVTATIGAIVALLIVIVIVIFMINFRTNRVIDSAEKGAGLGAPLGLSGVGPMASIGGGPVGSSTGDTFAGLGGPNFLMGARDAPRPIGYYYEDDDEYDMKTMYVGETGGGGVAGYLENGGRNERESSSSSSTAALNPDIERRRRIAQQHMYRPSQQAERDGASTIDAHSPPSRRISTTTTNATDRSPH
ncbi:clec-78, partial [Pristionchus pacificus]|uniref:Uncharacterized protein n=1 Tax=Pristionchus pacificus TaxID=54126 RepID=A0A8R1V5P3_PRIPA